ncbi:glutathione S-transferase 1-like [Paramacrobiotus metropolitanus]|uniref:glutathione S-transferase 1-like n=1 Tax=Paramacrobiotus metropolitanus TaxID=2943436 RepID=UPI0024460BFE|nr:glutathione S-transferase 1-like [Paramacrobiotus metropolitanus]
MVHKYKLIYFNLPGRAELPRWIFHYAGQDFEDKRIEHAQWPAVKPTTPDGTLPYLEVDGKPLSQSQAIARYLARTFKVAGHNAWEEAEADAVVDYLGDASKDYIRYAGALRAKDEQLAKSIKEKYIGETVIPYLDGLNRKLEHNSGSQYLVGKDPTWADFAVTIFLEKLCSMDAHIVDKYPRLKVHTEHVRNLPGIREWIAKRPANPV